MWSETRGLITGDSKVGADKSGKTFWAGYSTNGNRERVPCGSGDKEKGGTDVCACSSRRIACRVAESCIVNRPLFIPRNILSFFFTIIKLAHHPSSTSVQVMFYLK